MATFTDPHGVRIHYEAFRVDDPHAVVQLAHGVGEHIGRYTELIEALNEAGYSVWADDHRGHGQTGFEQHGGDLSKMGRLGPGGLRAAVDAVEQFTGVIRAEEASELPLVYLGQSWGSFLGQIIMNRHPERYDGFVFTGTAYRTLFDLHSPSNTRFGHTGPTPMEWLSRDPEVARAFMADPYATAEPLPKLFGLPDTLRLLGRPARDLPPELPLLIMSGTECAVGGERSVRRLAEAYVKRSGLRDVELIVYAGARHEPFNETNRAEVRADLIRWLDERFAVD